MTTEKLYPCSECNKPTPEWVYRDTHLCNKCNVKNKKYKLQSKSSLPENEAIRIAEEYLAQKAHSKQIFKNAYLVDSDKNASVLDTQYSFNEITWHVNFKYTTDIESMSPDGFTVIVSDKNAKVLSIPPVF